MQVSYRFTPLAYVLKDRTNLKEPHTRNIMKCDYIELVPALSYPVS